MYQVLVVDDEKEIREGLAAWDWMQLPLKVAGSCAHGLEALRFLSNTPVDILLTDIRMPFMDGIELMDAVSRQYPFVHTVVLSGYSEFEYARRAMQLGAEDYLLKPVNQQDMLATMGRLIGRMDAQRQSERRMELLRRQSGLLSSELRRDFLDALFHTSMSPEELEYGGMAGEVMLEGNAFAAVLVRMDDPASPALDVEALRFSLNSILYRAWDEPLLGYHMVHPFAVSAVLLSKGAHDRARYGRLSQQLTKYRALFRSTFSIVAGPVVGSAALLHKSYAEAHARATGVPANSIVMCPALEAPEPAPPAAPLTAEPLDRKLLGKAKRFMQENFSRSITLKDAADHVYVSPGHLSALFKANGETFLKALTRLRVDRARELLDDADLRIYEIVGMVGYTDTAYFTEVFKRQTGVTPTDYRNRRQGEPVQP